MKTLPFYHKYFQIAYPLPKMDLIALADFAAGNGLFVIVPYLLESVNTVAGLATYFRFSFRFFKKGSCQLLAKVCARSTG